MNAGSRALQKQFRQFSRGAESGAIPNVRDVELVGDRLDVWRFKLHSFDQDTPSGKRLNDQLLTLNAMYDHPPAIIMEARFPPDYPNLPFLLRVVSPRMAPYTGHVTAGGSICIEALTTSGGPGAWQPSFTVESIVQTVVQNMLHAEEMYVRTAMGGGLAGPLQVDLKRGKWVTQEYSLAEANAAFQRTLDSHGWGNRGGRASGSAAAAAAAAARPAPMPPAATPAALPLSAALAAAAPPPHPLHKKSWPSQRTSSAMPFLAAPHAHTQHPTTHPPLPQPLLPSPLWPPPLPAPHTLVPLHALTPPPPTATAAPPFVTSAAAVPAQPSAPAPLPTQHVPTPPYVRTLKPRGARARRLAAAGLTAPQTGAQLASSDSQHAQHAGGDGQLPQAHTQLQQQQLSHQASRLDAWLGERGRAQPRSIHAVVDLTLDSEEEGSDADSVLLDVRGAAAKHGDAHTQGAPGRGAAAGSDDNNNNNSVQPVLGLQGSRKRVRVRSPSHSPTRSRPPSPGNLSNASAAHVLTSVRQRRRQQHHQHHHHNHHQQQQQAGGVPLSAAPPPAAAVASPPPAQAAAEKAAPPPTTTANAARAPSPQKASPMVEVDLTCEDEQPTLQLQQQQQQPPRSVRRRTADAPSDALSGPRVRQHAPRQNKRPANDDDIEVVGVVQPPPPPPPPPQPSLEDRLAAANEETGLMLCMPPPHWHPTDPMLRGQCTFVELPLPGSAPQSAQMSAAIAELQSNGLSVMEAKDALAAAGNDVRRALSRLLEERLVLPEALNTLLENGVSEDDAEAALKMERGDLNAALALCFSCAEKGTSPSDMHRRRRAKNEAASITSPTGAAAQAEAEELQRKQMLLQQEAEIVLQRFEANNGLRRDRVKKIERIQNLQLYTDFDRALRKIQYRTKGQANVRSLFHGADVETLRTIVKEGLDHRVANPSGALGTGAYFAESSTYSDQYSRLAKHSYNSYGGSHSGIPPPFGMPMPMPFGTMPGVMAGPPWGMGGAAPMSTAASVAVGKASRSKGGRSSRTAGEQEERQDPESPSFVPGCVAMLLCEVVLGNSALGMPNMRRPPPGYQSTKGSNVLGNNIYAVYDISQAYTTHIVHYK